MKRRDMLPGLAVSGFPLEAQPRSHESRYIPQPHLVEDRKLLYNFMDEFPFIDLVTASPAATDLRASEFTRGTLIRLMTEAGSNGCLLMGSGRVARGAFRQV